VKRLVAIGIVVASLALPSAAPAFATTPPAVGQPNVDCPGPMSPPGFSSSGFMNVADSHYANDSGSPASMDSNNTAAESQYDVACYGGAH
jgi:hypothetical protein